MSEKFIRHNGKYFIIYEVPALKRPKTKYYRVCSKKHGLIGLIKWFFSWRQYCFYPCEGTIWSISCLEEIGSFIKQLMEEKQKVRKGEIKAWVS